MQSVFNKFGEKTILIGANYLIIQVVVFLWFAPYLSVFLRDDSRYFYLWSRSDAGYLLGSMFIIASGYVVIGQLLHRINYPVFISVYDHILIGVLGAGILSNVAYHFTRPIGYSISQFGMEIQTGWLILAAVVGFSFARPELKIALRCKQFCQIISPVMFIIVFQLLWTTYYPATQDPLSSQSPSLNSVDTEDETATPIYLFVFDEWSYQRTFQGGNPRPMFKKLTALTNQSVAFHQAHSPAGKTKLSLPRILFQTDWPVLAGNGRTGFKKDDCYMPSEGLESIFIDANNDDYQSIVVGFLLPYRMWLGDQVDVCRSYSFYPHGEGPLNRLGLHAFKAMGKSTDPWSSFAYRKLHSRVTYNYFVHLHEAMKKDVVNVISGQPRNTFAIIHYPLPHQPFLFKPDGSLRGPQEEVYEDTPDNYNNNLAQLDRVIGEFVELMKKKGIFDDALLILTSDHSWRDDPEKNSGQIQSPDTHVPLIVKLPGQNRPFNIKSRFVTSRLRPIINYGKDAKCSPEGLVQIIESSASSDKIRLSFAR